MGSPCKAALAASPWCLRALSGPSIRTALPVCRTDQLCRAPDGAGRPAELPASGLLSLFHGFDEDDAIFWRDQDYLKAFYWPDISGMHDQAPHQWVTDSRALQFENSFLATRSCARTGQWSSMNYRTGSMGLRKAAICLATICWAAPPGTAWATTHARGREIPWQLALALATDAAVARGIPLVLAGRRTLMAFIEDGRLRARDFSHLQVDCG
jgi:hypothetical protein